jgi:ubiquinone/menaquinone biosynthesis C-methylase UbiE
MRRQDAHFDLVAHHYDETIPDHVMAHLTARRVELARSLVGHGRVLDVGCGTGRFLDALPDDYEATGVDLSAEMLARARERGLDVVEASGDELPFETNSFDMVTTFAVLHHLIDRELVRSTLREMLRVARPGGALLVWDHNPLNPYWTILMARLPQDQGDERLVPARFTVRTLRESGARDVHLRRMTFTPDFTPARLLPLVARMESGLERIPGVRAFAAHNVVVAQA